MPPIETSEKNGRVIALFLFSLVFITLVWAFTPRRDFPENSLVSVSEGMGLQALSEQLEEEKLIRSPFWFRATVILLGGERRLKAGHYYFKDKEGTLVIAWRIVKGDYQVERVKLTIPEGFTVRKISALFDERFTFFDNVMFERMAPEGYLFPDTYFMPVTTTASSTVKLLRDNFVRKIFDLMPEIELSGKTLEEIITMASIIEAESNTQEAREIVSGILWKRIKLGLPLQVDASFAYVNGKTTEDLTLEDLKIDSPFNTYLYTGLPPAPISNPGIESIKAAIHPTTTPYLYFLTGHDGKMYYAKTFEAHVLNKQKYLSN